MNRKIKMNKISKHQKEILVEAMLQNIKLLEGKSYNMVGPPSAKKQAWQKLAKKLNKYGGAKTVPQWSKCWRDLRAAVKKKAIRIEDNLNGPLWKRDREALSNEEKKILRACRSLYLDGDSAASEDGHIDTASLNITTDEIELNLKKEPISDDENTQFVQISDGDQIYSVLGIAENTRSGDAVNWKSYDDSNPDCNIAFDEAKEECDEADNSVPNLIKTQITMGSGNQDEVLSELRSISAIQKTTLEEIQKQTVLLEKMCALISNQRK